MLALAAGRAAGWREALDLEHDVCYSAANHWSALTDGTFKYIFHARDGEEQLFNTRRDPHELDDLAGAPEHGAELARWRARLAEFLAPRGPAWVSGGKLALRPRSILHSPNYPGCTCHPPKPAAG
jgi:arylsulfatase A-like enzyme